MLGMVHKCDLESLMEGGFISSMKCMGPSAGYMCDPTPFVCLHLKHNILECDLGLTKWLLHICLVPELCWELSSVFLHELVSSTNNLSQRQNVSMSIYPGELIAARHTNAPQCTESLLTLLHNSRWRPIKLFNMLGSRYLRNSHHCYIWSQSLRTSENGQYANFKY